MITPFRRAVLDARSHADAKYAARVARLERLLAAHADTLAIRALVRLDPRQTFIRTPAYSMLLLDGDDAFVAASLERTPVGPQRTRIPPTAIGGDVSMQGVLMEATFRDVPFNRAGCCRIHVLSPDGRMLVDVQLPTGLR